MPEVSEPAGDLTLRMEVHERHCNETVTEKDPPSAEVSIINRTAFQIGAVLVHQQFALSPPNHQIVELASVGRTTFLAQAFVTRPGADLFHGSHVGKLIE